MILQHNLFIITTFKSDHFDLRGEYGQRAVWCHTDYGLATKATVWFGRAEYAFACLNFVGDMHDLYESISEDGWTKENISQLLGATAVVPQLMTFITAPIASPRAAEMTALAPWGISEDGWTKENISQLLGVGANFLFKTVMQYKAEKDQLHLHALQR